MKTKLTFFYFDQKHFWGKLHAVAKMIPLGGVKNPGNMDNVIYGQPVKDEDQIQELYFCLGCNLKLENF